jgi:hypothetical protein
MRHGPRWVMVCGFAFLALVTLVKVAGERPGTQASLSRLQVQERSADPFQAVKIVDWRHH